MAIARRRLALLIAVGLAGLGNAVYFFTQYGRSAPLTALVRLDEDFLIGQGSDTQLLRIVVSLRGRQWSNDAGIAIPDIGRYHADRSAALREKVHGYPPIADLPIFVGLGRDASLEQFVNALHMLSRAGICHAGFEELAIIDASHRCRGAV